MALVLVVPAPASAWGGASSAKPVLAWAYTGDGQLSAGNWTSLRPASGSQVTCATGVQNPVSGQAGFRDYLNRSWKGGTAGSVLDCPYDIVDRTFGGTVKLVDPTYYIEGSVTIASGGTFIVPTGVQVRYCPGNSSGDPCFGRQSGAGSVSVNGTFVMNGSFDASPAQGISVGSGGTLKGSNGTFFSDSGERWSGVSFGPGSTGSLTSPTITYTSHGVTVLGSANVTIGDALIDHVDGPCVTASDGGNPVLNSVKLASCNGAAVEYDAPPPTLTDSLSTDGVCTPCGIGIPGGTYPSVDWKVSGLPIVIDPHGAGNDVHVANGTIMTVSKATLVFGSSDALYVDGGGTLNLDSANLRGPSFGSRGQWGGIGFLPGSNGMLSSSFLEGAGSGLKDGLGTATFSADVLISGSSPTLTHMTLRSSAGNGVEVRNGGAPKLARVAANDNGSYAFQYDFATALTDAALTPVVSGLTASGNGGAQKFDSLRIFGPQGLDYTTKEKALLPGVGIPIILDGNGAGTSVSGTGTTLELAPALPSQFVTITGGDVNVNSGATLDLEQRNVELSGNSVLVQAGGKLDAVGGTTGNSLTSARPFLSGSNPQPGDWGAIGFMPGSGGSITGYDVSYGGSLLSAPGCGSVAADMFVCGAKTQVSIGGGFVNHSLQDGILALAGGHPTMAGTAFGGNSGWAFRYGYVPGSMNVSSLTASGNAHNGIEIDAGGAYTGPLPLPNTGIFIDLAHPLELGTGSKATVSPGAVVHAEGNLQVDSGASLNATGAKLLFGGELINSGAMTLSGDTLDGLSSTGWPGALLNPASTTTITQTQLARGGNAVIGGSGCGTVQAALYDCKASLSMSNSVFKQSFSDDLDMLSPATSTLRYDSFGNVPNGFFAVDNNNWVGGQPSVDARQDWWSSSLGPYNPSTNVGGNKQAAVSNGVNFTPWLTGLNIIPSAGPAGSTATIIGRGYKPGETVPVKWDCSATACANPITLGTLPADVNGNFNLTIHIPDAPGGSHTISDQGAATPLRTTNFTVQTTLGLNPTSGTPGTTTTVTGTGFGASETVTITANYTNTSGTPKTITLGTASSATSGGFTGFHAPIPADAKAGTIATIAGKGNTSSHTATAKFSVTS